MPLFLKLRNNISLEGDIQLAEREIVHLFDKVTIITINDLEKIPTFVSDVHKTSYIRKGDVIGYVVEGAKVPLKLMAKLLSFIQEIWCEKETFEDTKYSIEVGNSICIIPMMAMLEILSYMPSLSEHAVAEVLTTITKSEPPSKNALKGINRINTSSPHVHSFHKYKAKTFPRFIRSLIVSNLNFLKNDIMICDPYVGSGTTLIESSLLGYNSFGYDIDPLSCFITEIKALALNIDINNIYESNKTPISTFPNIEFFFPLEIEKKFKKRGLEAEKGKYEKEISNILAKVSQEKGYYQQLSLIALSDALTRKFCIRMLGTGSGRFALEINKKSIDSLFKNNINLSLNALKIIELIKGMYHIETKSALVYNNNATKRPCEDDSCDIIVTSPPYLPASSGRENYFVSKMISMKALGIFSEEEEILSNSVGSMTNNENVGLDGLPKAVTHLYNWLTNDDLRRIKAKPIVAYYNAIKKSLKEDKRTIKNDGKIIYIIGKESVFYSNATKEILYKVKCDKIFKEIAEDVGLKICEMIDIELDKKNMVARPRTLDKYYETAIVMSK